MMISDFISCRDALVLVELPPDEPRHVTCGDVQAHAGSPRMQWRGIRTWFRRNISPLRVQENAPMNYRVEASE